MYALRLTLIFLVIYMIVRAFIMAGEASKEPPKKSSDADKNKWKKQGGVPKGIGEYVDYEEIDKRK
jgi:hypothetical protein